MALESPWTPTGERPKWLKSRQGQLPAASYLRVRTLVLVQPISLWPALAASQSKRLSAIDCTHSQPA